MKRSEKIARTLELIECARSRCGNKSVWVWDHLLAVYREYIMSLPVAALDDEVE